jgi:hypothetical protein
LVPAARDGPPTVMLVPAAIYGPPTVMLVPAARDGPPTEMLVPAAIYGPPTVMLVPAARDGPPTEMLVPAAIDGPPTVMLVPAAISCLLDNSSSSSEIGLIHQETGKMITRPDISYGNCSSAILAVSCGASTHVFLDTCLGRPFFFSASFSR